MARTVVSKKDIASMRKEASELLNPPQAIPEDWDLLTSSEDEVEGKGKEASEFFEPPQAIPEDLDLLTASEKEVGGKAQEEDSDKTMIMPSAAFSEPESYKPEPVTLEPDKYSERLLKYIPAEVIALYLTLDAIVRSTEQIPILFYWGIFVFGIAATYLYLWRVEKVNKKAQLVISVGAFIVWVFTLGGPFTHLSWYDPIFGGILLPMYTFMIAIVEA